MQAPPKCVWDALMLEELWGAMSAFPPKKNAEDDETRPETGPRIQGPEPEPGCQRVLAGIRARAEMVLGSLGGVSASCPRESARRRRRRWGLRTREHQAHPFALLPSLSLSPPPHLPPAAAARRRLLGDGAGAGERKPLPGAPEHRAPPPHLPLRGRTRNGPRRARHAGAG